MTQYTFNTGATLNVSSIPEFANLNTQQLPMEEIRILVDTSIARTVILPYSTLFPVRNVKITIVDITGAASGNNITIQASTGVPNDSINGSPSYLVTSNFGAIRLELLNANEWSVINVGAGGGGSALTVNMTYAQLVAAIGANSLITGQRILLTDYATSYYLQYSGALPSGIGGEEVNVGAVEPLLLTAISSNQISMIAESISNPQDLILYLVSVPDGNYEYASISGKGCIVKRIDRELNISRDYDWRTILFRRWETVIGNGNFWSWTPVAGAAFIDTLCFGSQVVNKSGVNIASPLSLSVAFGIPYWLDNTVIDFVNIILADIGIAFGNTISSNGVGSQIMSGCSIANSIGTIVSISSFSNNRFDNFSSNTIISTLADGFTFNTVSQFVLNTIENAQGNNVAQIQNNICSKIEQNTGSDIKNNNIPTYNITGNISKTISGNTNTGDIDGNSCYFIEDNSNAGLINGNVCDIIFSNTNAGNITGNIAGDILTNTNNGNIVANTISSNITGNSCQGTIQDNTGRSISGNNGTGNIQQNNIININDNTCGDIVGNTGSSINDNVITGAIQNNIVNFLRSNTETAVSGIDGCSGAYFATNVLNGDIYRVVGNVENCTIENPIQVHTFVSEVAVKTISPTASMQSVLPATQSILDQPSNKHYIMLLATGVLTFPTEITN